MFVSGIDATSLNGQRQKTPVDQFGVAVQGSTPLVKEVAGWSPLIRYTRPMRKALVAMAADMSASIKRFLITRVTPLSILIVGAVLLLRGGHELVRAFQSSRWPFVTGTVTTSAVEDQHDHQRKPLYFPKIVYAYDVDGAPLSSDKVSFADSGSSIRSDVQTVVECPYTA